MERSRIISEILREVHERNTLLERTWTAPWLLSPIHSNRWILRTAGSIKIDGEWENVLIVNWTDRLPDGSRLDDEVNTAFLQTIQKAAFLIRETGEIGSSRSLLIYINILKGLTQWIYANSRKYQPSVAGLSFIDNRALKDFIDKWLSGGLFEAGAYAHRLIKIIDPAGYQTWRKSKNSTSVFNLPDYLKEQIFQWLDENECYSITQGIGPTRGLRHVSRSRVAEFLQANLTIFRNEKATAFFRQFEPDYIARFPGLVVRTAPMNRLCISQRTRSIEEVIASRANVAATAHTLSIISTLQRISAEIPLSIPVSSSIAGKSPIGQYYRIAEETRHTPWMPLHISLSYLNESLRWVLSYGTPLVEFYLKASVHFKKRNWLDTSSQDAANLARLRREQWVSQNLPEELSPLKLKGWAKASGTADIVRETFSVTQAMTVLVGACAYLITNLAPSRIEEILLLEKACLSFKNGDGFWLRKLRGKDVEEDVYGRLTIPVPRVVAAAVGLLGKIGVEARKFSAKYKDALGKYLFYLPQFHDITTTPMELKNTRSLNYAIDTFCDFVALVPDELGRRWYPRVHENRKSFILTFIWCFKYAALDAARMLAGHYDVNHILAYIRANFSGAEISEFEADYLAQVLWDFGISHKTTHDVRNIDALYRRVCSHFHVREISEIEHSALKDWLELCLGEENYIIDIIDIVTETGNHRIAITIRFAKASRRTY